MAGDWKHDCNQDGCWMLTQKVQAELVRKLGLFPRGITGTDLDWVVEVGGGGVLVWEWKRPEAQPPNDAQERALVALSDPLTPTVVMQLTGDVKTLTPQHIKVWRDGQLVADQPIDQATFVEWCRVWAAKADSVGA